MGFSETSILSELHGAKIQIILRFKSKKKKFHLMIDDSYPHWILLNERDCYIVAFCVELSLLAECETCTLINVQKIGQ
jgi:hypothetical protein